MNFNRLARLGNKLPQHIRISDSLGSFKRQLGVLYKSHLTDFDINNRCRLHGVLSAAALGVMYDNTWSEKHICSTLILRCQKLDSEVGGWL